MALLSFSIAICGIVSCRANEAAVLKSRGTKVPGWKVESVATQIQGNVWSPMTHRKRCYQASRSSHVIGLFVSCSTRNLRQF